MIKGILIRNNMSIEKVGGLLNSNFGFAFESLQYITSR